MEAFHVCSPMDVEALENRPAVMEFVNQAASDIRHKLHNIDRLTDKSIQELLAVAEEVCNNRETSEDKQMRAMAIENMKQIKKYSQSKSSPSLSS